MKLLLSCLFLLAVTAPGFTQDLSQYKKYWWVNKGDSLPYRVLLPENYDPGKEYPLVFFLHGAGERGSDNEKQLVHGGKLFLQAEMRSAFPAIVVFPQCPADGYWSNVDIRRDSAGKRSFHFLADGPSTPSMKQAIRLLAWVIKKYPVDKGRVYAGGLSMGGMGTFELVRRRPKWFAAAFAICGGADPATAKTIKGVHWWIFHGGKDDIVSPDFSRHMAQALEKAGADVKLTIYPQANHNSWDSAFAESELLPWLFAQHK